MTKQNTTLSYEALLLCLMHLVTHMAYGKRYIKITNNLQVLVLQDRLPKTVPCSAPVPAEQDSALLGRENFVALFGTRLTC